MKKVLIFLLEIVLIVLIGAIALGIARQKVVRISGADTLDTSLKIADMLKENLNVDKFKTIVVTRSDNYPDGLSGSYLAGKHNAPILLVSEETIWEVRDYIEESIAYGGTVYLLGDSEVLSDSVVGGVEGVTVRRLGGNTRLETNLNILREAGITEREIIVCSAWNFADSLSASVLNRPVLLVGEKLTDEQKEFLAELPSGLKFYIIGGTSAVSNTVAEELTMIGSVMRISGENRCETSANVARKFFAAPDSVVLIYSHDFAEGLCSIPLAMSINAPLILTNDQSSEYVTEFVADMKIRSGVVAAGKDRLSDELVVNVFGLADPEKIKEG